MVTLLGVSTKFTPHQAWLVLGWMTVFGQANQFITSHQGQLSLLSSVGWEMSTGQSTLMLYSWGVQDVGKGGSIFTVEAILEQTDGNQPIMRTSIEGDTDTQNITVRGMD